MNWRPSWLETPPGLFFSPSSQTLQQVSITLHPAPQPTGKPWLWAAWDNIPEPACTVGWVSQEGSSITQAYLRLQSLTLIVLGCREWQPLCKRWSISFSLLPRDEDGQILHCTVTTPLEALAAAVGEGQYQSPLLTATAQVQEKKVKSASIICRSIKIAWGAYKLKTVCVKSYQKLWLPQG